MFLKDKNQMKYVRSIAKCSRTLKVEQAEWQREKRESYG